MNSDEDNKRLLAQKIVEDILGAVITLSDSQ